MEIRNRNWGKWMRPDPHLAVPYAEGAANVIGRGVWGAILSTVFATIYKQQVRAVRVLAHVRHN